MRFSLFLTEAEYSREYCAILCGAGLKGQDNQVRNIEEYTLSKYGDILGR